MPILCENKATASTTLHNRDTVPRFDSLFETTHDDDFSILKYPFSSSVFAIVTDTPLPDSDLRLTSYLVVQQERTEDGYVLTSSYIDEESFGRTLQEAYADFLASVRDKYYSLQRREVALSARDRAVLANIRSLLH